MGITTDHTLFLFPAFVLSYLFFRNKKTSIAYAILPLIVTSLFFGSWILVKYYQYSQYEYYPNGPGGTPIKTDDLSLLSATYPGFFKDFSSSFDFPEGTVPTVKRLAFNFGYLFNLQPVPIPLGLNFSSMKYLLHPFHIAYMFLVYLPLALIVSYGIFHLVFSFIRKKNHITAIYMCWNLSIFIIRCSTLPISLQDICISHITFYYLLALGLFCLLNKLGLSKR